MRSEWIFRRLDELGGKKRPVLKAGPFGSAVTKDSYVVAGFKVYGQQEVVSGDVNAERYYISPKAFSALKSCAVEAGDILITMMGTVGRLLVVPEGAEPGIINPRLMRIALDKTVTSPAFVSAFLGSSQIQKLLERRAHGGTMLGLNADALGSLKIPVPPLSEQRKIAEILRTWDDAIEKLTALRKANLSRRIWMRSHLFTGRKRLPGHNGEWCEVALGQVLTEHGLNGTGAEEVFSVSVHKGLINQIEHLGRSFAAADTGHYNRVLPGDIVYTKSPTGEFPLGIIKQSKIAQEVIVSPLYGVFTPATHALGVILDALFESPIAVRNYLHPLVQKGAKNTIAITNRRFLEGKLLLPMDPAEQAAIAEVAITTQAELACIDAEIDALIHQKRGLMQKLLTGEWRVTVDPTTPSNPAGETQDGR
jgi:type I restriction enzyme, S subunit